MAGMHMSRKLGRRLVCSPSHVQDTTHTLRTLFQAKAHSSSGHGHISDLSKPREFSGSIAFSSQSFLQHSSYGGDGSQNKVEFSQSAASSRQRIAKHVCSFSHWVFFPKRHFSYGADGFQNKEENLQMEQFDSSVSSIGSVNAEGIGSTVSEVTAATVDCSYPTAFLQLLIENVHLQAGLPWWAAVGVTTLAVRVITLPAVVYQMKSMAKLALMRPELESISNEMKESGYEPLLVKESQQRIKELFRRYEVSPISPFLGAVVQAPVFICFFFGIRNMAVKVESFKEGGIWWFSDLSTPDGTYIFPLLTAMTFWANVELNALEGMEGNPMASKMKNAFRFFAFLLIPLTAAFEKALFCYWITSNLWSLCQASLLKRPAVKHALGIPDTSHLLKKKADASKPFQNL